MFTKITHVSLFVHDQDAALAFYQKIGFVLHTDAAFGPMRWLTLCMPEQKDVEVALIKADTEQEKALVGKQAGDKPVISLESNDCLADYERLKAAGIEFLEKPAQQPWGISMAFKDVSGNLIYVCQPS